MQNFFIISQSIDWFQNKNTYILGGCSISYIAFDVQLVMGGFLGNHLMNITINKREGSARVHLS